MTALTAAILATTPKHLWPLNEASGTAAADLVGVGTLNGTASVSGVLGGVDAPTGIGGKAALFTGAESILLRSAAILGGLPAWSVAAWVRHDAPTGDLTDRYFYGEAAAGAGNDFVGAGVAGNNPNTLKHVYGADAGVTTIDGVAVYIWGVWSFMVITRNGANIEIWWDLGRRTVSAAAQASSTWTNASITAKIGAPAKLNPWKGAVSHLAVWDRALSKADQRSIFYAGTPLTRTPPTRRFFNDNAVWNQPLTTPGDAPSLAPWTTQYKDALAYQMGAYSVAANIGTGPFFETISTDNPQRVRLVGGQNSVAAQPLDLWTAFGHVPIPANFVTNTNLNDDREAQIYISDTDELYEFFIMQQSLAQAIVGATLQSGGSIPTGVQVWAVLPELADNTYGTWSFAQLTMTTGMQKATLTWETSEGAHHYRIMRLATGGVLPWRTLATIPFGTNVFVDDGSIDWAAGAVGPTTTNPTAVTTDWGCTYGGYLADTDNTLGIYPPEHYNWGASGSSLPLWGGTISLEEARAYDIPHAVAIALPLVEYTAHVYPASRNDGFWTGALAIQEGTRFQLDPAFDINTIPFLFERAVAKALQDYGGYVRDVSPEPSFYIEDQLGIGRNWYPEIFEGRYDFEIFDGVDQAIWQSIRVIDPTWTQSHVVTPPTLPPDTLDSLTDDFSSTINLTRWPVVAAAAISSGAMHLAVDTSYSGGLSTSPTAYDLTDSEILLEVVDVPTGNAGNEAGVTLRSTTDPNCYIEMVYTDQGLLVMGYNSASLVRVRVAAPTYNAALHAWWRIRHSAGNLYWETSPDGFVWTTRASIAWSASGWPAQKITSLTVSFFAGNFNGFDGAPDFVFDNINLAPTEAPPEAPAGEGVFTIASSPWPEGTSVSVYPAAGWVNVNVAPTGVVAASASVANGRVTFTGLQSKIRYVAYALGVARQFMVRPPVDAAITGSTPGSEREETLEAMVTDLLARVEELESP